MQRGVGLGPLSWHHSALCPRDLIIGSEKIHDPYAKSSALTQNGTAADGTYLVVLSEAILVVATDTTWEGSRNVSPDGRDRMLDAAFAA